MLSVHRRRALERQLRFYIFSLFTFIYFFVCSFFVCSLFPFVLLSYRSQFGIPRGLRFRMILRLALHVGSPPADWLRQTFSGPLETGAVNFRFAGLS